ncbi:ester cyclase [Nocardia sp. NBC_00416]|uniref:ester cyclase n=1 Tax=Nocardia sp. NBC_00416 TaxID=2975991 RepID=UPI002E23E963
MTNDPQATARRMYEAFNARDYTATQEIFTEDFYSHPLDATGPSSVAQAWKRFHQAFPAVRVVVEDMIIERDRVATRTSVHGIPGRKPPTMMEIFAIRDGRIAELWGLSSLDRDN